MGARWVLAVVAAVAARAGAADETCELQRADRTATQSRACMRCHDGSRGQRAPFEMRAGGGGMSHPVEVDYGQAAARQPDRYAPPESLPKDVPLVQGRIECTTCHDPAAPTVMRVVEQPRLCFACHRMGN